MDFFVKLWPRLFDLVLLTLRQATKKRDSSAFTWPLKCAPTDGRGGVFQKVGSLWEAQPELLSTSVPLRFPEYSSGEFSDETKIQGGLRREIPTGGGNSISRLHKMQSLQGNEFDQLVPLVRPFLMVPTYPRRWTALRFMVFSLVTLDGNDTTTSYLTTLHVFPSKHKNIK